MQLPREGGERISTGWAGSLVGAFGVSLVVLVGLVAQMQRGVAAALVGISHLSFPLFVSWGHKCMARSVK